MNIKEARQIVKKMVLWTMIANGVTVNETPELITEDLPVLLKANRMVEAYKKRSDKRIAKVIEQKGEWRGRSLRPMTIADRGIAALYVAANFQGDNPNSADVLAQQGNNIVFVLDKRYLKDEEA